ncbi:MAG: hypothetical protein IMY72_03160 [Bacteroidetes bacterium]|nr:hypothetical protein [Bacteroidota bacterium]
MRLNIEIDNLSKGRSLAEFLRTIGYVKSVEILKDEDLTDEDWILPGRPATDEEHEALAKAMEKEKDGIEANTFFKELKENILK